MNSLVVFVVMVGAVTAQSWPAQQESWRGGYGGAAKLVIPAPLAHDGRVIDTPEINQAKAAHFAAHEAAIRSQPNRRPQYAPQEYNQAPQQQAPQARPYFQPESNQVSNDYESYDDRNAEEKPEPRWRGPLAKIEFTQDGKFIKDTPEVAHARAQHLAAISDAKQKAATTGNQGYEGQPKYWQQHEPQNGAQYDDGQYREEVAPAQYNAAPAYQGNQQFARAQENDGQYRGEGDLNGQYSRVGQGQRSQGYAPNPARRTQGYY